MMPKRRRHKVKPLRHFERREAGKFPYYKLATWNPISCTWMDGKRAFDDAAQAAESAACPGKYRISSVHEDGSRVDGSPFEVGCAAASA